MHLALHPSKPECTLELLRMREFATSKCQFVLLTQQWPSSKI